MRGERKKGGKGEQREGEGQEGGVGEWEGRREGFFYVLN